MRVLQVNTVISYGSTGMICQSIARGLIADGHECMTVYGRGDSVSDIPTYKIGTSIEQGLHYLESKYLDRHGLGSVMATKQLARLIKDYQPDLIQLHNIHGYYLNYVLLFKELKNYNIPVVWLLHDQWPVSGGAAYIEQYTDITDLKDKFNVRIPKERSQYPALSSFSLNRFKENLLDKQQAFKSLPNLTLVTPSKWLENFIKKTFLADFPIMTIYNGIDSQKFQIKEVKSSEKIRILGAASVWDDRKGLQYLRQLAKDLDDTYEITLIGVSDDLILPETIKRVGKLSNDEMIDYYNSADVFVNPTLGDNFPTVNIEAQLCGTPVVTFDTGGSGESICLKTGKVVEVGNYKQLLEAVKNVIKKNQEISDLTSYHARRFTKEIMVLEYLTLYKKISNGY